MVVVMQPDAEAQHIDAVEARLREGGFVVHRSSGVAYTILGAIGDEHAVDLTRLEAMPGVREVVEVDEPYKLASCAFHPDGTVIHLDGTAIGDGGLTIMAGPCSVEHPERTHEIARHVAEQGGTILRGGAFKPRTSPHSFQGLGEAGLKVLREAADAHGLHVVTEAMCPSQVELVAQYADIVQIGARNMQNYQLLHEAGRLDVPVLLKRGLSAKVDEWLLAAEYVMSGGNRNVILCERGVRTFNDHTRFTLDVGAIAVAKQRSHLPVIVDPSHAAGHRDLVAPLALAGVAAGADGVMVEIHTEPSRAWSDGPQALTPPMWVRLANHLMAGSDAPMAMEVA
ncbi:MAG: 3-deoxy-7-phosphoheptulonate synthase [Candidatus Bipolaricaulia bacterium]